MFSPSYISLALAVSVGINMASCSYVESFALQSEPTASRKRTSLPTTRLHAVAGPPMPAKEEGGKEKKRKDSTDDEWTERNGGFIPNILRREPKTKAGGKRSDIVTNVETLQEYKDEVADEKDRMVVVRFFAPWCRSCRAAEPAFTRMAKEYSPTVKFVEVPLKKDNAFLHEGLGVPSVPFGHIYHPTSGLVEEMKISKKFVGDFDRSLRSYVVGSCDLSDEPRQQSDTDQEEEEALTEFQ